VRDVAKLKLVTEVNGEVRQDALVSQLIFDIPVLIETLSRVMTLEPGDLIATGTPAGVGMGMKPAPVYLKAGDRMRLGSPQLGVQEHEVEPWRAT
jgi:2-keto-4-pentenoate hydratase/2-oxohepta-3-ene-1,7-dioic acid hydratase in catechol pathway